MSRIELGEGFFYPDEKKYCFMKRSAADVHISDDNGGDYITYTPGFGEFKDIDLNEYLINHVKDNKLSWCDVEVDWLRHCHYGMDSETKELGEFLESSGCECEWWEWNPETQEFQDAPDEEEEEDEDE